MKNENRAELKAVKIYNSMSEETTCFEANLYLDGVKLGSVKNRGTGGETELHLSRENLKKFNEYAKTLPMWGWSDGTEFLDLDDKKKKKWVHQDAEMVVDNLLDKHMYTQDLKKELRKGVVIAEDNNHPQYMVYSYKKYPRLKTEPLHLKTAKWWKDEYEILNCMPFDKALALWVSGIQSQLIRYKVVKNESN